MNGRNDRYFLILIVAIAQVIGDIERGGLFIEEYRNDR